MMYWTVYLSGEIHSDWRDQITHAARTAGVPAEFVCPVLDHQASDDVGVNILGPEDRAFWKDHKAAKINAIRTRSLIEGSDVVVVRFGDQYRQWNAAFDAGYAIALNKPLITLHDESLDHALKEIDAAASAVARHAQQVADVLSYVMTQH
jgi:YtoQ family protein